MIPDLSDTLATALALESRRAYEEAAQLLDAALVGSPGSPGILEAPAPLRFRALLLRADLAVSMNDLGPSLGILAEAKQIRLTAEEREALSSELRRADDLEVFLTHRGCAG